MLIQLMISGSYSMVVAKGVNVTSTSKVRYLM